MDTITFTQGDNVILFRHKAKIELGNLLPNNKYVQEIVVSREVDMESTYEIILGRLRERQAGINSIFSPVIFNFKFDHIPSRITLELIIKILMILESAKGLNTYVYSSVNIDEPIGNKFTSIFNDTNSKIVDLFS